jgi:hypothetical protein
MNLHSLARAPSPTAEAAPQRRTIPFDYQFHFKIFDEKDEKKSFVGQIQSSAVTVSIEAAFVAVSVGYGFLPRVPAFTFGVETPLQVSPLKLTLEDIINSLGKRLGEVKPDSKTLGLEAVSRTAKGGLAVGPLTEQALLAGFQINPAMSQRFLHVVQDGGQLKPDELAEIFQTVEPPTDRIQFLYALYDKGSGRAFQSEPLLNIAGLGTSDGDRPFRYFATPIVFPPRSTIQLDVIPKTDFHGDLYVSLHGYKVLGGAGTPTGQKQRGPGPIRRMRRR